MRRFVVALVLAVAMVIGFGTSASADIWIIHDLLDNICDAYSTGSGSGFYTVTVPSC
jgi:hypothetical protein